MEINAFLGFIQPYIVELKDFEQIGTTPFRLNALNGIYAPAKTGKTRFILEQLEPVAKADTHHIIWLDGDRNIELKNFVQYIHHVAIKYSSDFLSNIIVKNERLDGFIFILDSFKNFSFGKNMDDNTQCQYIFDQYQKVLNLGATLIIIFHATKLRDGILSAGFKTKGNEDTIESNMDFYYKFERTNNTVTLTVQCARDANMRTDQKIQYTDIDYVVNRIREIVSNNVDITLRELRRIEGMAQLQPTIDALKGTLYVTKKIKSGDRGAPREVVKLIA